MPETLEIEYQLDCYLPSSATLPEIRHGHTAYCHGDLTRFATQKRKLREGGSCFDMIGARATM